jgi:hypothetical protein
MPVARGEACPGGSGISPTAEGARRWEAGPHQRRGDERYRSWRSDVVRATAGAYEVSKGGVAVEVEMDCEDDGGDDEDQEEEHQARAQHHRRQGGLPRR